MGEGGGGRGGGGLQLFNTRLSFSLDLLEIRIYQRKENSILR